MSQLPLLAERIPMAILTLISDFGQQDYLTGAIKGRILSVSDVFRIVDISHSVAPFNPQHAAYICRNAIPHFPSGSYHMVLVDLFDARLPHLLLVRKGQSFIALADNGLIGHIYDDEADEVVALPLDGSRRQDVLYFAEVMAQAFRRLLEGEPMPAIGRVGIRVREKGRPDSRRDPQWMEGHIIHIDPFENVVVDITREDFEAHRQGRTFQIVFLRNEVIDRISESYADVPEGEKLALFNAAGYLEIAVNKGNAAGLFGLQPLKEGARGGQVRAMQTTLFYHLVHIRFG